VRGFCAVDSIIFFERRMLRIRQFRQRRTLLLIKLDLLKLPPGARLNQPILQAQNQATPCKREKPWTKLTSPLKRQPQQHPKLYLLNNRLLGWLVFGTLPNNDSNLIP
jgi:hypothetical protein